MNAVAFFEAVSGQSVAHTNFFLILCYIIFFEYCLKATIRLKFQLTMELGLNLYMLRLKVTQINIITVAIVLVLLPKITILSVLNKLFFLQTLQDAYCVFLWYLERKSTIINTNYNEMQVYSDMGHMDLLYILNTFTV